LDLKHSDTLQRFHLLFPNITLQQTYGLSELGILRSKSKSSDSLWVKIGGEGYQTRIVKDILQIKAASSMLGYLNASSPITEDGWFITGDRVLQDGEFVKFLGRDSDIINVGGEKVNPVEVENVIRQYPNVEEVTIYSEKNFITGSIVCAKVSFNNEVEDKKEFVRGIKRHCRKHLERFKIPAKIIMSNEKQYNKRFKKIRKIACES